MTGKAGGQANQRSARRPFRWRGPMQALACAMIVAVLVLVLLTVYSQMEKHEGVAPSQAGNAIERSTEKGPVKLFVRVSPREPRLSDLVEMDVRVPVPTRCGDQTARVRTGRGRFPHSRLQRAAPRGGFG